MESAEGGTIVLSTGEKIEADTLVWAAGVEPHPLPAALGLAVDDQGRLLVDEHLRVRGDTGLWSAGDCAAVPDLVNGGTCPPTAQYAVRQARQLADNLVADLRSAGTRAFHHQALGQLITVGRYQGIAQLRGATLRGFLPWFLRRTYYASTVPTAERKMRMVAERTLSLLFHRDVDRRADERRPHRRRPWRRH